MGNYKDFDYFWNKEGVILKINKEEKTFVMWGKSPKRKLLKHQSHPGCTTIGHPVGGDLLPQPDPALLCSLFGREENRLPNISLRDNSCKFSS